MYMLEKSIWHKISVKTSLGNFHVSKDMKSLREIDNNQCLGSSAIHQMENRYFKITNNSKPANLQRIQQFWPITTRQTSSNPTTVINVRTCLFIPLTSVIIRRHFFRRERPIEVRLALGTLVFLSFFPPRNGNGGVIEAADGWRRRGSSLQVKLKAAAVWNRRRLFVFFERKKSKRATDPLGTQLLDCTQN